MQPTETVGFLLRLDGPVDAAGGVFGAALLEVVECLYFWAQAGFPSPGEFAPAT
jgi:hypothetical protein